MSDRILGRLPLFPLPSTVFFPGTELHLHVFEQRYRELIRHSLENEGALAVVLLRPGYESNYEGRPPVFDVAGAGRIVEAEELPDGRFDIVLRGTERTRIIEEHRDARAFRTASCKRLEDERGTASLVSAERCLRSLALRLAGSVSEIKEPVLHLLEQIEEGSGILADQLACRLIPNPLVRQAVLEERDLGRRLDQVTREVAEVCLRLDACLERDRGPLN